MKKMISVMLVLVLTVLCFTGCMYGEEHITLNEDGSGQCYSKLVVDKAVVDQIMEKTNMTPEDLGLGSAKLETVDGVESYVVEETTEFASYAELKAFLEDSRYTDVYVGAGGVRYVLDSGISKENLGGLESMGFDLGDSMKVSAAITMPEKILKTTGTLSEDGKTATFVIEGNDLYDVHDLMVSTAKETKKPTLSGITGGKTYGSAKTVTARDASGIKTAKYKKNDGKYYSFDISREFTKNGKYTVYATDYYGNKTTKTFTIRDTTKPTVKYATASGKTVTVTNGKTYSAPKTLFFDDNCQVKSVKCYIDGTKASMPEDYLENGAMIDEAGSYKIVITDVNGNSRTVSFKIK